MNKENSSIKFHIIMAEPFIVKADQIQKIFNSSDSKILNGIDSPLQEKISYIQNVCREKIETATGYGIKNPKLLNLVFLHEDIAKICNEPSASQKENFGKMKKIKEDFLALAFIGDSALELGALPIIWGDKIVSKEIPLKGDLDAKKKNLVENKQLSMVWDSLELYDDRILIKRKNESQKLRGSRMEAIFGILYLEGGLDAVENSFKNLNDFYKKNS
jgi:dsRNA-specific ribonuclease